MCSVLHAESDRIIMIYLNSLNNFTAVAASMSFSLAEQLVARSLRLQCDHILGVSSSLCLLVAVAVLFVVVFSPSSLLLFFFSGAGWSQILYYICHREVNDFQNGICVRDSFLSLSLSFRFLPGDLSTVARKYFFFCSVRLATCGFLLVEPISSEIPKMRRRKKIAIHIHGDGAISGNAQHLPNDEILR